MCITVKRINLRNVFEEILDCCLQGTIFGRMKEESNNLEAYRRRANCLECGCKIYGREDKKFCSATCKNMHNNRLRSAMREQRNAAQMALQRNHDILSALANSGQNGGKLDTLCSLGFDPDVVSGIRHAGVRVWEYSCYNITYRLNGRRLYKIEIHSGT